MSSEQGSRVSRRVTHASRMNLDNPGLRDIIWNPYRNRYEPKTKQQKKRTKIQTKLAHHHETESTWIGDRMQLTVSNSCTRFWLQNCNGLPTTKDKNWFQYDLHNILDHNIHYYAFPEANINASNGDITSHLGQIHQNVVQSGVFTLTNTKGYPHNQKYQPGGVSSGFHGRLENRYACTKRDKYGRWHYHEFFGKANQMRVYTLYRVNLNNNTTGGSTAWAQQQRALLAENIETNPRAHVIDCLISELQNAVNSGISIILMADMNEGADDREKTNNRLLNIGLTNLMQHRLGIRNMPKTHKRGSKAIDHVWMTPNLINCVEQAGYAPFNTIIENSDHRGIFFDVNLTFILDNTIVPLQHQKFRRLKSTIPKRVKKYNELVNIGWKDHDIENRVDRLVGNLLYDGMNETNERILNNIDNNISEILRHAEKKCCKIHRSCTNDWSINFGAKLKAVHSTRNEKNKARAPLANESPKDTALRYKEALNKHKTAVKEYQAIRGRDDNERTQHILTLAKDIATETAIPVKSAKTQLLHIEAQRKSNKKIKSTIKSNFKAGVAHVLIPARSHYGTIPDSFDHYDVHNMWNVIYPHNGKDINEWERVTEKNEVERIMVNWQKQHFMQANETPLAAISWKDKFDNEQFQQAVLDGQYKPPSSLPLPVREVLLHLRKRPEITEEIQFQTTFEEFKSFIRNAKEKTSTSPSGRSYSHYKALLSSNEAVLQTIHSIIEICIHYRIILNRWKKTTTTLIEKDAGMPKVHRMRAIHIIEAEVQFIAKTFYILKMMRMVDKYDLISDEQYGGRNKHQAQSVLINKHMYYNITSITHIPAAFMDDDARACYDRILTSLNGLENRRWGVPFSLSEFTTKFIESQVFNIRTAAGESTKTYQYSREEQIQGSGQGVAWAGPRWLNSGDTCSQLLRKHCAGMYFFDPSKSLHVRRTGDHFVDDRANGTNLSAMTSDISLLQQLQHDEQFHAHVLFSLGHKLAIDKCKFYIATFQRDSIRHRHKRISEEPGVMSIQETFESEPVPVRRLEPFQAHESLGCDLTIDGNQAPQLLKVTNTISTWKTQITFSTLTNDEKFTAYDNYLKKSLQYRFASTSFIEKECSKLDSIISPILLNAASTQKNSARAVLYCPVKYGGFGFLNMWCLQGIEKLRFFIMHYRRHDVTGQLLKICMRWHQLEAGVQYSIFSYEPALLRPILTPSWITNLHEFLASCSATVIEHDGWTYTPPRENDFFIQEVFMKTNLSTESKQQLNEVRLSLKVLTASDIVPLGENDTILPTIYNGYSTRNSSFEWPICDAVPQAWVTLWQHALLNYISPKLRTTPLGEWVAPTHQTWPFQTNTDKTVIVNKNVYTRRTNTRNGKFRIDNEAQVPSCDIPADVTKTAYDTIHLYRAAPIPTISTRTSDLNTAFEYYNNAPDWQKRIWGTAIISEQTINIIAFHLQNDNIVAGGDGGVAHGRAAHAWCIVTKNTFEPLLEGAGPTDGIPDTLASLRPESVSCIAVCSILHLISSAFDIHNKIIPFYTDNTTVVSNSKHRHWHSTKHVLENDIDVILELNRYFRKMQVQIQPMHVKGHQDTQFQGNDLSKEAQLNIRMDELVGDFLRQPPDHLTPKPIPLILPSQQVCVTIDGKAVTSDIETELVYAYQKQKLFRYYDKHFGISRDNLQTVDWANFYYTIRKHSKRNQLLKYLHRQWDTRERGAKWGQLQCNKCLLCQSNVETWKHVLQCTNEHMHRKRELLSKELKKMLDTLKTFPELQTFILENFKKWLSDEPIGPPSVTDNSINPILQDAYRSQESIGFDNFFQGLLVQNWRNVITEWYKISHAGVRFHATRWMKSVQKFFLEFGHDMWSERCNIVHAAANESNETRIRQRGWERCLELKKQSWRLPAVARHLLNRDKKFFRSSPILQVTLWNASINTAIDYTDNTVVGNDIRNYGTLTNTISGRRRRRPRYRPRGRHDIEDTDTTENTQDSSESSASENSIVPESNVVETPIRSNASSQSQTTLDNFILYDPHA